LREAVEDCSTDFELGCLTIKGCCHDALTKQLEAVHFRFDQAAAMITAPFLPDGASKPFDRTQRFIAGSRARAIFLPWSSVAADHNDRMSTARSYRGMALFGVVRAVPTNTADLLILRDLRQQIGEDRRIPNRIAGDFNSPDIKRLCVDPDMLLALLGDNWRRSRRSPFTG
jgi:hypothetical protein